MRQQSRTSDDSGALNRRLSLTPLFLFWELNLLYFCLLTQGKLPGDSEAAAHLAAAPSASRAISGALLVWSAKAKAATARQEIEMTQLLRAVSDRGQIHNTVDEWTAPLIVSHAKAKASRRCPMLRASSHSLSFPLCSNRCTSPTALLFRHSLRSGGDSRRQRHPAVRDGRALLLRPPAVRARTDAASDCRYCSAHRRQCQSGQS